MPLPTIPSPIYTTKIPSTKKEIKFRPFIVKEEKALLLAMQSNNKKTIAETTKQVIRACTFDAVDIDKLAPFDIEYLFLQLRIQSKGNIVSLNYICKNKVNEKECGYPIQVEVDLTEVDVVFDKEHTKRIMLTDTIGCVMRYPTMDELSSFDETIEKEDSEYVTKIYNLIRVCIESVFSGDVVEDTFTTEELQEWLEGLDQDLFEKIINFFKTMPALKKKIHLKCKECGNESDVDIEGLQNFLD